MVDVILPHEQADFDAMAAALGAHLMDEKAVPVAPHRLNRNVRAFLTLYGAELPFVEARDLPPEPIQTVTLVDTQSLVTLKGMSQKTRVQVVDHHALRPDLPEDWTIRHELVGACTTLFVEGLREHNGVINAIHATLLLLGIYEDTGSLTYAHTTPRDIRAAAFLLEQGANLQILASYLNPPLADDQRAVYDRMLSTAQRLPIQGQNIIVAAAEAPDLRNEISTIAHKLRDLLDPDALFLLVRTSEGIRIVARSVSDAVDVAQITEHFGGGGHGRAAAALIHVEEDSSAPGTKRPTLEQVTTELTSLLPRFVQPSVTVRQVMSPRPLMLDPDTPAEKALVLMRRYGFEGFPVVERARASDPSGRDRVLGLLTRRAVDRAISHRLNLPASSLMEAGEVTVQPSDSLDHLRRVMIDSGWGQIPVIDAEAGRVTGIVTRTDLLKSLPGGALGGGKQNLSARLDKAMPPARLALLKSVAAAARERHLAVYIVGGFVRDLILDRPSLDFDVVVEGDAIALATDLAKRYGGRILGHGRFGTAKWTLGEDCLHIAQKLDDSPLDPADLPETLDLISARTEFYDYPTALPTVERSSIKLDLHRRDFTINTMALRLDGRHYGDLYDFWGGMRDLKKGLIRVLHSLSFVDDPTRLMRAVRFEQRFGFAIEERTRQLMDEARPMVRQVSGDRLRHELNLIFAEVHPQPMLARLDELGLLEAIHPALRWPAEIAAVIETALRGDFGPLWPLPDKIGGLPVRAAAVYLVWLMQIPLDEALEIALRLRLSGEMQDLLADALALRADLPALTTAARSRAAFRLDETPILAMLAVWLLAEGPALRALIETYLREWRGVSAVIDGNTLIALGIPRGPRYRELLSALRAGWIDGTIRSETEERARLEELLSSPDPVRKDEEGAG